AGRAGLGRSRPRQVSHHRGIGGTAARRAASPPALFLLALSPGQRAVPVYRPARSGGRVRARGSARGQAGEARGRVGPRRAAGGGFGALGGSAVLAVFGPLLAAEPHSAAEEGADIGGVDPAARRSGAPGAG